jgi:hypothetical protein
VTYNSTASENPLGLLAAYRLYRNSVYRELANAYGVANLFILSAAWGLVRADYLLPYYDLTFGYTKPADRYKHRMPWEQYTDFCQLHHGEAGPLVYFGGTSYLPLFERLTNHIRCNKIIFFASASPPSNPQWMPIRFEHNFQNWHYACARDFMAGKVSIKAGERMRPEMACAHLHAIIRRLGDVPADVEKGGAALLALSP